MDSITHTVMGACLGEAIAGKKLGKKAMLFGIFANNIPDIDMIANFWVSPAHGLLTHRGITHSILCAVLFSFIFAWISTRWFRKYDLPFRKWLLLYGSGLFLHIFMDSLTTYGTGWFEPFSHYRVAFNVLFIIDPLLMLPMLVASILLWIKKRGIPSRQIITLCGLSISALYLVATFIIKSHVNSHIKSQLSEQKIAYEDYIASPAPLNNILWYTMVKSDSHFYTAYYAISDKHKNIDFIRFPKNDSLLLPYQRSNDVHLLKRFSKNYYHIKKENDSSVTFSDIRFGQLNGWKNPNSGFVFNFDIQKRKDSVIVKQSKFSEGSSDDVKKLIERIKGR